MAVILDTNALSAFADGDKELLRTLGGQTELAVPTVVLGEYLFGIRQSRQWTQYEQWLKTNLPLFELLVVGRETAGHYADVRRELKAAGRTIPSNDLWVAALAREYRMAVISRDRHFDSISGIRSVTW